MESAMADDTPLRGSRDQVAGGGGMWKKRVELPSERGASRMVTEDLLEQLGVHGWDPTDIFSIHLAAEEAIVNAIVHGNKLDPTKQIGRAHV